MTRLRISAHNLQIEIGRHKRPNKVPVNERLCETCQQIEDEYHFIMICAKFETPRKKLLDTLKEIFADFDSYSAQDMFGFIMNLKDPELIKAFERFITDCIAVRDKTL